MGTYGDMLGEQLGTQAASSGLGGIFDMIFQPWRNEQQYEQSGRLMRQQMEGQKEMGRFNFAQQLAMWNATNTEAQMEHLKKAGLNPALMYGGGGAGGSTMGGGQAGNVTGGMGDPRAGGGYTGMNIMMPAQVRLMEAQARNLDADTAKKSGVETQVLTTENELKQLDLKVNQKTLWERINEIVSRSIEQQEKGVIAGQQRHIGEETVPDRIKQIKQEAINTGIQAEVMKQGIKLSEAQINKLSADIVQRGMEIAINQFIAETNANQPELSKVIGNILNATKAQIEKIMGIGTDITKPKRVGQ